MEITLELIPDKGLLVNRLRPPEVSLESPWTFTPKVATVSGKPWAEHPELYFSQVDAVHWTLKIPADTPPGRYEATVTAKLALCESDSGFCFVQSGARPVALKVTETGAAQAELGEQPGAKIIIKFHAPRF